MGRGWYWGCRLFLLSPDPIPMEVVTMGKCKGGRSVQTLGCSELEAGDQVYTWHGLPQWIKPTSAGLWASS